MTEMAASHFRSPQYSPCSPNSSNWSGITVFCDFDGPLVDVSDRYYSTYSFALENTQAFYRVQNICLPIQALSKEQFWQMKQDRVPDIEIAMRSGLQGEEIDVFLECVREIVNQPALLQKDKMQSGVSWALALLHSQGIRLVLVTLRSHSQAKQILQNYGLARLFSGIYGTEISDAAYQNYVELKTQLLAQAAQDFAISPSLTQASRRCSSTPSAWMIGDTEADIVAGQTLGIPTIALTCGIRSHYALKKCNPTRIQSDLLSAAHYLLGMTHFSFAASSQKSYEC